MRNTNEYDRNWRTSHRELSRKYVREYEGRITLKLFEIYGFECACCGENHIEFLTLDHLNKVGSETRRKSSVIGRYREAIKEKDHSKYQILCFNCNCAKGSSKQRFCKVHHPELYLIEEKKTQLLGNSQENYGILIKCSSHRVQPEHNIHIPI